MTHDSSLSSGLAQFSSVDARFVEWFAVELVGGVCVCPCTTGGVPCLVELPVPPSVGWAQPHRRCRRGIIYEGLAGIVSAHL
jgi:hypothetical protein